MSSNDNQANTGNQTGSNIGASRSTGETHAGSNPLHTQQQQADRAALSAALSDPNTTEQLQKSGDTSREKRRRLRDQQQNNSNNSEPCKAACRYHCCF
ncbi:hypothetical protein P154DRAFT_574915 [Amniculicola lignicola CBS 123094]|uniref:Uncharacterized protein n=1 Tax=Amniculicola lignicola CBS 123094 TaxID=1392246 RepID=A0A6A5WKQ7_9PLEO|nr:hypothetical protein P154DRAFT_574915 [Amniculicola lignicola CBS 123094]